MPISVTEEQALKVRFATFLILNGSDLISDVKVDIATKIGMCGMMGVLDWVLGVSDGSHAIAIDGMIRHTEELINTPGGRELFETMKKQLTKTTLVRIDPVAIGDLNLCECGVDMVE